jgi:hypothetical protein
LLSHNLLILLLYLNPGDIMLFPSVNKQKTNILLPILLMVVFAITRIPGMMPQDFSAAYALMFCAGVYFAGIMAWWLPLVTIVITDIALNFYYASLGHDVWNLTTLTYQLFNYVAYIVMILLGRRFKPQSSFFGLVGGGILSALLFYIITNIASWFFNPFGNPEYLQKTWATLLLALTKGTGGWPDAWHFFRNTLLSGGLFTALVVAAMKIAAASESPAEKTAGVREAESGDEPAEAPEESKA